MLTVSIDGQAPTKVKNVVLYDNGIPIACAIENSGSVMWADSVREPADLQNMLSSIGITVKPLHSFSGSVTVDPEARKPLWKPR